MPVTLHANPVSKDCDRFLYPHEKDGPATFSFEPGVNILLGANGAGKTTLMERMMKFFDKEKTPYCALMTGMLDNQIEASAFLRSNMDAVMNRLNRNYLSEGQAAKSRFAFMLGGISNTVMMKDDTTRERWALIDGIDSSQSIDQLRDIAGLFDVIVETAPDDVDVYLVVSTNQFELAKNRRCICVSEDTCITPKNYDTYSRAVMRSAKYLQKARSVSDEAWEDTYSSMAEITRA